MVRKQVKDADILAKVAEIRRGKYSCSLGDLAQAFGRSRSTMQNRVDKLIREGLLSRDDQHRGSIVLGSAAERPIMDLRLRLVVDKNNQLRVLEIVSPDNAVSTDLPSAV